MSQKLNIKKYIVVLLTIIIKIESAKILGFFTPVSFEHQMGFREITTELVKRGHQVTVITASPIYPKEDSLKNLTEINVRNTSYKTFKKYFYSTLTGKRSDVINEVQAYQKVIGTIFENIVKMEEVSNLLKSHRNDFDLLLLEAVYTPYLGFTHVFKVPTILVSSFGSYPGLYEMVGAPTHLTLYSNFYSHKIHNLSLWDKVTEIIKYLRVKSILIKAEEKTDVLLKNLFGSDMPPLKKLKNNVDMLFLNVNPIWNGNHPVPPSVIYIGGIQEKLPTQLTQDVQHYLDSSNDGLIYLNLETDVTSIFCPNIIQMFTKVFSELPYNILWKWDGDKLNPPVKSKNIKLINWLPQADVLKHKNVKIFITLGDLQSTDQAINAGVPLIGIPMWADQWQNVDKYVYHKIGIKLDFETLTAEQLRNAIIEIAETQSYRNNILRLRSLMQDQPQTPLERTIWWIEYVLRHGGAKHLRAPAANISWSEFLELELVGLFTLLIFTSVLAIFIVFKFHISHVLKISIIKIKMKKI